MEKTIEKTNQSTNLILDWIIRLVKGAIVGIGAIVPGLSGGVLAVVFGLYEPIMRFLGNLRDRFWKHLFFFIPVGIGGVLGVIGFSAVVDFAFSNYSAQFTWLFIGFISGTFPSLLKTSGKQGRKVYHWVELGAFTVGTFFFMRWMETIRNVNIAPNLFSWLLSGVLTGMGLVVPGLSPSNFLIYLGLYQPMARGIRSLDLGVILPLAAGVVICILVFARLISWMFDRNYPLMYHFILGVVVGSTLAIIPAGVRGWTILVCALLFILGAVSSYGLAKLDEKHPHESLF